MSERMFVKNSFCDYEEENGVEVLTVDELNIEVKVDFGEGLSFKFIEEDIEKFENWEEVGDTKISIKDLEGYFIVDNSVVSDWFLRYIDQGYESIEDFNECEDQEITQEDFEKEMEKVRKDKYDADSLITGEYYTYWDGSNHVELMLSHAYHDSMWTDITDDSEFKEVDELDYNKESTGHTRAILTDDGSVFEIYVSYYQGHITNTWTKVDEDKAWEMKLNRIVRMIEDNGIIMEGDITEAMTDDDIQRYLDIKQELFNEHDLGYNFDDGNSNDVLYCNHYVRKHNIDSSNYEELLQNIK